MIDEVLLAFTVALRSAGMRITHDRATGFLEAAALVNAADPAGVRRAGRATLCASPDDLIRFDQVFEAWFGDHEGLPRPVNRELPDSIMAPFPADDTSGEPGESDDIVQAMASEAEVLRHRDVAGLDPRQKALVDAMMRSLRVRSPRRRTPRREAFRRGEVDLHKTLRESLRQLGEPGRIRRRRRGEQPRRIVLLVDVSASMRPYADSVLRLCHRILIGAPRVEVFSLGTRLTRLTDAMRTGDPERALVRAGAAVPDWSGGTRLGDTLQAFLERWGARGMARGAVVVVFSDGWERGDAEHLGRQVERLHRLAHKVVWVNPHRGKVGYEPVQQGIVAVLPYCDEFVAGHSLRSFQEVLAVIGDA